MNPRTAARAAVAAAPHMRGMLASIGGPKAIVGRLLGFGEAEMAAGVPGWAWFMIGAGAGAVGMYFGKDRVQNLLGARR